MDRVLSASSGRLARHYVQQMVLVEDRMCRLGAVLSASISHWDRSHRPIYACKAGSLWLHRNAP